MLYQQGDKWSDRGAAADARRPGRSSPPKPGNEKTLKTAGSGSARWTRRAEWKQMYREVWRIERDFFYDPHYHGLDLQAAEEALRRRIWTASHRATI